MAWLRTPWLQRSGGGLRDDLLVGMKCRLGHAISVTVVLLVVGCGGDDAEQATGVTAAEDGRVGDLANRLEEVEAKLVDVEGRVAALEAEREELRGRVAALEAREGASEPATLVSAARPEGLPGGFDDIDFPWPGPARVFGESTDNRFSMIVYATDATEEDVIAYLRSRPMAEGWQPLLSSEEATSPNDRELSSFRFSSNGVTVAIALYRPTGSDQVFASEETGVQGPWLDITRE